MGGQLFFRALGPLEVNVKDPRGTLDLGGHRQRSVLAVLLINANSVVSVDALVDQLWGDRSPLNAVSTLQAYVSHLRRVLEPDRPPRRTATVLVSRPPGYSLQIGDGASDVSRFEHLLRAARRSKDADPHRAHACLTEANALWRGPAYADFAYEPFAAMEIARLSELRVAAQEDRIELELALGRAAEVIAELESLVAEYPLRERLRAHLMVALYRSGRHAESLTVFQDFRKTLADELGLDPSRDLKRLERCILVQDPELDWRSAGTHAAVITSTAARVATEPPPANLGHATSLVGREVELERFAHVLQEATAGRGQLVLIEGTAGIGKSRLVEALLDRARVEGMMTLLGRCFEGGRAAPFWPWIEVLRSLVDRLGMDAVTAAAGPYRADLAHVLPELVIPSSFPSFDPDAGRVRASAAIASIVASVDSGGPLVVALDDLHCADVDSLRAFLLLARQAADTKVVAIATFRDAYVDPAHPFADFLAQVARVASVRMTLSQLERDDAESLIQIITGKRPSPAVGDVVYERSAGNPFFIVEIARLLYASGAIDEAQAELARVAIPTGVRDVVRRRLALLSPEAQRLLFAAAVAGRDFDFDVVAEVSDLGDSALEVIDELHTAGLIANGHGPGQLRFSHVLIPDTLAESLSTPRRAWLHRHVAEAIERFHGDDPLRYAEVAHHTSLGTAAGDLPGVVELLRRAAQLAATALAFAEAEQLHSKQLELARSLPPSPSRTRAEVEALIDLAVILTWTRGYHAPEVGQTIGEALDLAGSSGAAISVAAGLYARWSHHCLRAEFDAADQIAAELHGLAERHSDPPVRFVSGLAHAIGAWGRGNIGDAVMSFARIEPLLAQVREPTFSRLVLVVPRVIFGSFYAMCRTLAGEAEHGARLCDETVRYARSLNDAWALAYALTFGQAITAAMAGNTALAAQAADEGIQLSQQHGFVSLMPLGEVVRGWGEALSRNSSAAIAAAERAADQLHTSGAPAMRHFLLGLVAEARLRTDDAPAALYLTEQAVAEANRVGERFWLAELLRLRAQALALVGDLPGAEATLEEGRRLALQQGAQLLVRRIQATCAEVASQKSPGG